MKFGLKVTLNILMAMVLALVIFWLSTFFLDFWTRHGDQVIVPNVKGMPFEAAVELLEDEGFDVVLQDSVYYDKCRPGEVTDQNPTDSAAVKPGREVFLTINAFYPRTVVVPSLTDISIRQARTTLEGLGIKKYHIDTVPSDYKDLVLSAVYKGKRLRAGERIPVDAMVILEIGRGPEEPVEINLSEELTLDSGTEGEPSAAPESAAPANQSQHQPQPQSEPENPFFE